MRSPKVRVSDPCRMLRKRLEIKKLSTQHFISCFSVGSGKWGIWWGAPEQRLEWQNVPKAPDSLMRQLDVSNQVHWAQEGPDVTHTLTRSFQHSLPSPFRPSAPVKHSQYLATGRGIDTLYNWIVLVPLETWSYFLLFSSLRKSKYLTFCPLIVTLWT